MTRRTDRTAPEGAGGGSAVAIGREDTRDVIPLLVAAALQGAVQLARTHDDPRRYEATVEQLRRMLLVPEPERARG